MEILQNIAKCVEKVTSDAHDISLDTHLIDDDVLDSLDSAVFLLELEKLYGIELSDEVVDTKDLYKVANLVEFIESR